MEPIEESSLNKLVLSEHPACRYIYVFKTFESYLLFGLLDNILYLSKVEVTGSSYIKKKFDGEVKQLNRMGHEDGKTKKSFININQQYYPFKMKWIYLKKMIQHENNIVGVFDYECSRYYSIDQSGTIYIIGEEINNDSVMDYDIFEDSPEKHEKWVIKDKKNILKEGEVTNFCVSHKKLMLLVNSEHKLSIEIINFLEGLVIKSIIIRRPGLPKKQKLCTLTWIPPERNIKEFLKNWCLNFEGNSGLLVVSLPEGNILAVDPNESNPEYLYVWPFPIVTSDWIQVTEDLPEGNLLFVTEGNSILKMTQYGEVVTEFLPIDNRIKAVLIKKNLLYFSDWSDTYKYYIFESQDKAYTLCLKGILCFGICEENSTFALSNNGDIYFVNDSYKPHQGELVIPDSSVTAVLRDKSEELEKINKILCEYDAYIAAINLAIKNLSFSVNAQIIYARKLSYTICISLKCLQEGITIKKHLGWNLFLTLKVGMDVITLSHKMRTNLTCGNLLTDVFTFSVQQQPIANLHIKAKFIYSRLPESAKFIPVIYIGEVYLDPSYFLQPAVEVELCEIESQPTIEEVFKEDTIEEQDLTKGKDVIKKDFKLQVEYRDKYPDGAVFKWLLSHSKPLWRSSLWSEVGESKKLEVAILGHVVTLEDCGTYLSVSGDDIHSCYAVKKAIFSSFPSTKNFSLPTESLRQLEICERTSDLFLHENISIEELEKLRENFRKTITSHLKP